jgi:hypothetical protein
MTTQDSIPLKIRGYVGRNKYSLEIGRLTYNCNTFEAMALYLLDGQRDVIIPDSIGAHPWNQKLAFDKKADLTEPQKMVLEAIVKKHNEHIHTIGRR